MPVSGLAPASYKLAARWELGCADQFHWAASDRSNRLESGRFSAAFFR